jgi:hypothetical protein
VLGERTLGQRWGQPARAGFATRGMFRTTLPEVCSRLPCTRSMLFIHDVLPPARWQLVGEAVRPRG